MPSGSNRQTTIRELKVRIFFWLPLLFLLAACNGEDARHLEITGGGFIFNYRLGEAHYGLVAEAARPLPEGAVVTARFEDPAGGPEIVVSQKAGPRQLRFVFDTPPLRGIVRDRDYSVVLTVSEGPQGEVIERQEKRFRSQLDQSVLPEGPLTIGPGYHRPPPQAGE